MTASRPGSETFVKEIYSFEVPSSTEWSIGSEHFSPDTYIDISSYIEDKKAYLNCYEGELRSFPHARSMDSIFAKTRSRGAEMNLEHAEAFQTLRRVI